MEWEWVVNYEFVWMIDDVIFIEKYFVVFENVIFFEFFEFGDNGWIFNVLFFSESDFIW